MDTLRGQEIANDLDDDAAIERPPAVDERRMQVRAYTGWASLLGDRPLPLIGDLKPEHLDDFGANSVLFDFSAGANDPAVTYLGQALRRECGIDGAIGHIGDAPARSLLARLSDYFPRIIADATPVGFEAEFVNQRDAAILCRGILLPFSANGGRVDFVLGVINWKEMVSQAVSDALKQEVDAAFLTRISRTASYVVAPLWTDGLAWTDDVDANGDRPLERPQPGAPLADWLAHARMGAERARVSENRGHVALCRAIGMARDFAIAADAVPEGYARLLADAGIGQQPRSPMTALAKLVFGATGDSKRLIAYAAALDHARAAGMDARALTAFLADRPGGLWALERDARARRRVRAQGGEGGDAMARAAMKDAAAIDPMLVPTDDDGLAVVVARREEDGSFVIIGALPEGSDLSAHVMAAAVR
ncbi:MAG: hypothetical protein AB7E60_11695 [Sphingobium sp.]